MGTTGGGGTSADIVPIQIIFGVDPCKRCWYIAQKPPKCRNSPLTPIITKISFPPFSARRGRQPPWTSCLRILTKSPTMPQQLYKAASSGLSAIAELLVYKALNNLSVISLDHLSVSSRHTIASNEKKFMSLPVCTDVFKYSFFLGPLPIGIPSHWLFVSCSRLIRGSAELGILQPLLIIMTLRR